MTKDELWKYFWAHKNIEKLENRITELYAVATKQTSILKNDADSIHGTGYQDRTGDILAAIADLKTELQEQLEEAYRLQAAIEKAIKTLPEREKYLIRARYIEGKTIEQICVEMNYTWRHTNRIHSKALVMLSK
ncbi:hypothetical protein LPY66_18245 [Dehalobacter sp. DCM]|uniref:sigma factor-like helix-turn-helix DNA-binding protein n=1 Tax=Dehalobacter sp. DCM TaxID=2907827 RepID=UPI003081FF35|nr:hypothetical protein LPY66_18245 [Dehalobacter sp. DCM]